MKSLIYISPVFAASKASISCPAINCDTTIGDFVCY